MKKTSGDIFHAEKSKRTPCGYAAGGLRASDGTRYEVLPSGQIVRMERKMSKAERKRHKKERRLESLRHQRIKRPKCETSLSAPTT
jgi:hypothetical protein